MARTVSLAMGAWESEEPGTARGNAAEDIVRVALATVGVAQRLIKRTWDDLFSERIVDLETTDSHLENVAGTTLRLAQQACEVAGLVEAEGYKVAQVPELL